MSYHVFVLIYYQGRERQRWGPVWLRCQSFKLHSALSEIVSLVLSFAAVVGLLPVQAFLRKHHQSGNSYHRVAQCRRGKFCSEFFTKFLSIFVHISPSIDPISLIWVSLERSFSLAELESYCCWFWSKVRRQKWNKGLRSLGEVTCRRHRRQSLTAKVAEVVARRSESYIPYW